MGEQKHETPAGSGHGRAGRGGMALFAFAARSLQQVSALIITLLAARFLLPAEFGVYALGVVFITLIQTLTYTGFYHFIVTGKDDDETLLSTIFWMILGLATAAAAVLALAAWPISLAFRAPDLALVLLLLAAIQPLAAVGAWFSAVLLRRQAVNLHFTVMFLQNLAALIVGAVLLWLWQSLFALVAYRYIRVLTGFVLYFALTRDRPHRLFDRDLARRAVRFSGGLYGARVLSFLSRYAGDLLLGLMFTTAEAGLYRFGNRVAGGATDTVLQPMRSFALTQLGAVSRAGGDLAPVIERFVGAVMLLTGAVAAAIIVLAPPVIAAFFNSAYLGGVVVAVALSVRAVLGIGALMMEPALTALGHTGRIMWFNSVWTAITLAVVFAAAPFGLSALAWSQAAVMALSTLAAFWVMKRAGIRMRRALRVVAVSLGLVVVYGLVLNEAWTVLLVVVENDILALGAALTVAALLGGATLVVGWKLRVFTLAVFSG